MSKKKYLDMISSVFLILLGAIYFYAASKLPAPLTKEPLGPAGFPQFLAILLIGLSISVLVRAVLDKSESNNSPTSFTARDFKILIILMITLILYAAGIWYVGYIVSTFAFCCVCFWLMGAPLDKPIKILVPSLIIAIACFVLFGLLFKADLGSGFLF
ncbi:MAG: tripartite tricarboxylate transporter TctB family protein [Solobacterium sp.]|nr:tripartite tricarboxylate transporter TctB family protein [Solobacterium sp.]MBQ6533290.1 tripartite tricarboxylate transporter TctB family protein [Solobacterium sp.]MBR0397902.1 tripartite tricarboxylate transporter TctB family protein [Eubacterium sp.]